MTLLRLLKLALWLTVLITLHACNSNPNLVSHEGYIQAEGGTIWYRVLGEGKNTPLLILHGGPGGTSKSFYLLSELSADRPIILFDQLGSGRSDHHQDTSLLKIEKFVEQVESVKSTLKLNEFYVLGHSWGAALGLEYYIAHPEGINAIIFNSPYFSTPIWKSDADTLISSLPDSIQNAIHRGEKNQLFNSREYLYANEVYSKNYGVRNTRLTSPLDTAKYKGNNFIYNYMWGPTEFTATGTLINYDGTKNLKSVKIPTLFITGEYDEARPVTVKYFQSLVSDSKFEQIENAGHGTMHDNQSQNISAIKTFLENIELK